MYSSKRWYAANDEASEKPRRKPTILMRCKGPALNVLAVSIVTDIHDGCPYPPRKPPTGCFGGLTVPTFGAGVASFLIIAEDRKEREAAIVGSL